MYDLIIHDDAAADLKGILVTDKSTAAKIITLIRELQSDQDLLDRLTQQEYGGTPNRPSPQNAKFSVKMWRAAQNDGMNLWRMRSFDARSLGFRFIYAFFPPETYVLLAIVEKAEHDDPDDDRFNYELNHEISHRIAESYAALRNDLD